MVKYYGEDLAYIHDVGHRHWAENASPGVIELLRAGGIDRGHVVDLGCGGGLWAQDLCKAGYTVTGVDISAAMIAIARKRVPGATFRRESLMTARLPACDAVTSLGECINYLFDPAAGKHGALEALFGRVHAALSDGGLFIFDLRRPRPSAEGNSQLHRAGRDWAVLTRVEQGPSCRDVTRHITAFRKVGRLYRRSEEVHRLRLYGSSEVASFLRRTGFRTRVLAGYGDFRFGRSHMAFAARKVS